MQRNRVPPLPSQSLATLRRRRCCPARRCCSPSAISARAQNEQARKRRHAPSAPPCSRTCKLCGPATAPAGQRHAQGQRETCPRRRFLPRCCPLAPWRRTVPPVQAGTHTHTEVCAAHLQDVVLGHRGHDPVVVGVPRRVRHLHANKSAAPRSPGRRQQRHGRRTTHNTAAPAKQRSVAADGADGSRASTSERCEVLAGPRTLDVCPPWMKSSSGGPSSASSGVCAGHQGAGGHRKGSLHTRARAAHGGPSRGGLGGSWRSPTPAQAGGSWQRAAPLPHRMRT